MVLIILYTIKELRQEIKYPCKLKFKYDYYSDNVIYYFDGFKIDLYDNFLNTGKLNNYWTKASTEKKWEIVELLKENNKPEWF